MPIRTLARFSLAAAFAALVAAAPVGAQAGATQAKGGQLAYAPGGYVDLSQDPSSGAGFYPLPGGGTGVLRERRPRSLEYGNDRSAIGTAIASEAIEYDYDEGYAFGHGHGVFDPVDGVGTPFFGGYYR